MGQHNILDSEDNARLELYTEVQKGLHAIDEGKTKTAEEVRIHMENRRKAYQNEEI